MMDIQVHESEVSILLRWQYSTNWCEDSMQSLSKYQVNFGCFFFFCITWQTDPKIHVENSHGNILVTRDTKYPNKSFKRTKLEDANSPNSKTY